MKQSILKTTLIISLLASMIVITGCEDKGPVEEAGEKIDDAIDDSRDAIDEAADDIDEATKDAANEVKDATN